MHNISVRKKDLFKGNKQLAEEMATHTTLTVHQPQGSAYNHPCGDLFHRGRRREYLDIVVPLYRASIEGDLEAAKVILKGREHLVRYSITEKRETPLHIAATGHSLKFVRYLLSMMSKVDLELQNRDGNTAFCLAAISGNVGMVKVMLEKNQALPIICGSENMMPLYLGAFHGKKDIVTFLYEQSDRMLGNDWTNDSRHGVLLKCIQAGIFDVARRILEDNEEFPQDKHVSDVLLVLARKREAFLVKKGGIFEVCQILVFLIFSKQSKGTLFLRLLWKRMMESPKDFIDEILRGPVTVVEKSPCHKMDTYPSQILFIAAKMNNRNFLAELIRQYPDLIWTKNDDGQTIFHIAVSHRHHVTFCLLYAIGSMKDLITPIIDHEGNNILHLVGKNPEKNEYDDWKTPMFQMFSEFFWYKEVESILPPPCREVKNAAGQTPHELFVENHKNLFSEGMKSINESLNISMVVAALVCTIGFSVVYSIPGGFDQNNGFPVFLHNQYFISFVELGVISFIMSTTSIIFFLSVILSRHHGNMELILQKWVVGQLLLLYSVFFLVTAFCSSFLILYPKTVWAHVLYVLGFLIVVLYATVCVSPVFNTVIATFGTRFRL